MLCGTSQIMQTVVLLLEKKNTKAKQPEYYFSQTQDWNNQNNYLLTSIPKPLFLLLFLAFR